MNYDRVISKDNFTKNYFDNEAETKSKLKFYGQVRAKKKDVHVVYSVDAKMQIVFLRAFRNYNEYKRFLEDKKEIRKIIAYSRA